MLTHFVRHSERFPLHYVILNVVKNLSERIAVRAIVEGRAIPEILRSAQDDSVEC